MIVLKVNPQNPDPKAIKAAADAVLRGELVIFPTETVYGLAADALDTDSVERVVKAKGRAEGHPLPIQIADMRQLLMVVAEVPENAVKLADRFWPGPLTIVFKKKDTISDIVSGGKNTIGIRIPDHKVALKLLKEIGKPIIATSANRSGNEPPLSAEQAISELGDNVSVVLDAGKCVIGVASTVIDISDGIPRVLRLGAIGIEEIKQVLGDVNEIGYTE